MKKSILLGVVLSGLTLFLAAETAQAQFRGGRGGRGGGWGGVYYSGFGYGGPSYGYGQPYYNSYYSRPYYGGYPSSYYSSPRYGYGYVPSYSGTYYTGPTYTYGATDMSRAQTVSPATYQSFYAGRPSADRARLHILLPTPDARLWVENEATQQRGPERWFDSPPVQTGKEYTYTLQARWMQNGREVTAKKEVTVRPGQETTVTFQDSDVEQTPVVK